MHTRCVIEEEDGEQVGSALGQRPSSYYVGATVAGPALPARPPPSRSLVQAAAALHSTRRFTKMCNHSLERGRGWASPHRPVPSQVSLASTRANSALLPSPSCTPP